jgi:hypothetical protein
MAPDPTPDLEHLISNAMGSAFEGARRALADEIRRRQDTDQREARAGAFRSLRDAASRLDAARSQSDLLSALLEEAGRFAARTALLLTFPDGAHGWAAFGFDGGVEGLRLSWDEPGLSALAAGRGSVALDAASAAALAGRLGGGAPLEAVLVPLVLRDRIAAALYADRLRSDDAFAPAALQVLAFAAAQALELQVMRQRTATPTLYGAGAADAPAALPLWDPSAQEAAPAAAAPAAPAAPAPALPEPTAEIPLAAPAPSPASVDALPVTETTQPMPTMPEPPAPAAGEAWGHPAAEPIPEPAALDAAESIEAVPAEPAGEEDWAADAPTGPGVEPWPVESAPAPWESEPEPAAEEQAWVAQEEQVATLDEATPELAAEAPAEPWQYGEAVEEVAATADGGDDADTPYEAVAAVEEDTGVEEVGATAVEEVPAEPTPEPAWQEPAAAGWQPPVAAPWQEPPPPPPPESTTSQLYPSAPAYPSEATVRISRELLTAGPLAPARPVPAPEPDPSEDRTVMLRRAEQAPATPAEPLRPAPPPEPPRTTGPVALPPAGGSTEVQPPPDLEGPGWAFRAESRPTQPQRQQNEETSALHEEARRLARLLVSEIKLYNEEIVEEGRRNRDIYPRLQDDIDRSRQMYEERVDPRVRDEVDYFQQEMVNILAGGDAGALGM